MDNTPGDKLGVWRDMRLADALVANLLTVHIHIIIVTNFCRFILIFYQMALSFPRVPIVFTRQVLSRPIHPENENAAFRK